MARFGFVLADEGLLQECEGNAKSHSLDSFDQWHPMEENLSKWPFTSPTHTVRAFLQALPELEEVGVEARYQWYCKNHEILIRGMENAGIRVFLSPEDQSPILTAF